MSEDRGDFFVLSVGSFLSQNQLYGPQHPF